MHRTFSYPGFLWRFRSVGQIGVKEGSYVLHCAFKIQAKSGTVTEAPSTLIRFQTKTELFCLVFKKICVHTYRFSYRFRLSTLQRHIRFENAVIPSVRMSKWTRRMRISICRSAKMARNWSHMVVSIRHFETQGRVVWRPVVSILMTSPFSDSIVFFVHTREQRFRKALFSNRSTLESVFDWLRLRWSFSAL